MGRDYRKLKVFESVDDLAVRVYLVTGKFPREEMYGLATQMRRAAVSVPANIVEGSSRSSESEYLHFLDIAKGSLEELGYYIHLSHRLGLLDENENQGLQQDFSTCIKQLQALVNALRKR